MSEVELEGVVAVESVIAAAGILSLVVVPGVNEVFSAAEQHIVEEAVREVTEVEVEKQKTERR